MTNGSAQFYRQHHKTLIRFLTRLTHCRLRAEDLAQTIWLRLLSAEQRGETIPEAPMALRRYLFVAARNLFLDEYLRKHVQARVDYVDPESLDLYASDSEGTGNPEHWAIREELRRHVQSALHRLPEEQSCVVAMWSLGHSIEHMARHANAPVDTVLSRKKYAFARMRSALAPLVAEV
ncbi:MAG: sigma-70 family RNA polymerase sigma factor [Steroidobacteraceae bacterium]|nr:sigma-70 family RNA polymerase sigma factor [Steroidobacteraceae bacterium]MDW8258841.1 sigma-70 family RNA polymerase sigma factor [Gammaproteobacteria bacterium]